MPALANGALSESRSNEASKKTFTSKSARGLKGLRTRTLKAVFQMLNSL